MGNATVKKNCRNRIIVVFLQNRKELENMKTMTTIHPHSEKEKAPLQGLNRGLWEIRTLDLFRVKEAL